MRQGKKVSVILSPSDFAYLQDISDRFGVKKSEFVRLFIQGLKVGEMAETGKGGVVEVGGYGYEFSPELLKSFVGQLETLFEGVSKDVKVVSKKTKRKGNNRLIDAFPQVA